MTEVDKYWSRKLSANKALADPAAVIKLKSSAFEKELRKAFEAGRQVGIRQGHQLGKMSKLSDAEISSIDDLFQQLGEK